MQNSEVKKKHNVRLWRIFCLLDVEYSLSLNIMLDGDSFNFVLKKKKRKNLNPLPQVGLSINDASARKL